MAGMKSWLEKIKNRILKKDSDGDLVKSKIQSEEKISQSQEVAKENLRKKELPDLITPTNEEIKQEINEVQREEAIRVKENQKVNKRLVS